MRVSAEYSPADFVALLAEHVPDRYRHAVRYFGLLAPRSKARTTTAIFLLLGQRRRPRPRRLGWAYSVRRDFGVRSAHRLARAADALGRSTHCLAAASCTAL